MDAVFTILFGGISLVLAVWAYFLKRKADKFDHYVEKSEDLVDMSENRLQKVKDILCDMGCQPKLTTEKGGPRIEVAYQGETFLVGANNESAYICIWDYAWVVLDLDDPRISVIKECLNLISPEWNMVIYYYEDVDSNCFVVCTKMLLHLPTGKYNPKDPIERIFVSMIELKNDLRRKYEEVKKNIGEDNSFASDNSNSKLWN